jgi:hypothetical protein
VTLSMLFVSIVQAFGVMYALVSFPIVLGGMALGVYRLIDSRKAALS